MEKHKNKENQDVAENMIGDCRCGHSIIYHAVFVGCIKCDCDEFRQEIK